MQFTDNDDDNNNACDGIRHSLVIFALPSIAIATAITPEVCARLNVAAEALLHLLHLQHVYINVA